MTAPIYGLTAAQADCARVIGALTSFEGNSPSYAEIAAELSLQSVGGVHRLVHGLIDRGWIKRPPRLGQMGNRRNLHLTRPPPPFDGNPIAITEAGREYLEDTA